MTAPCRAAALILTLLAALPAARAVKVGDGAMAAILGLDKPDLELICEESAEGEVVSPANMNGPGQVVIAGHAGAVQRAMAADDISLAAL